MSEIEHIERLEISRREFVCQGTQRQYLQDLKQMILEHAQLKCLLLQLNKIDAESYLCAGIIRNWIWSSLHGQHYSFDGTEIDVIFYDEHENNRLKTKLLTSQLSKQFPKIQWDVTNQAKVHEWYRTENGQSIDPLISIEDALSYWPETATAIAVRMDEHDDIDVIAPFGLTDLFELKLRWNDRLVSRGVFDQRIASKEFFKRWPKLTLVN